MIKSMTGFGRCEKATDQYKISVEIKSVNHRYLDMSIKMPKKFNYFEAALRNLLKNDIQRGKVDIFITYEDYTTQTMQLKYNEGLAAEYMEYFRKMKEPACAGREIPAPTRSLPRGPRRQRHPRPLPRSPPVPLPPSPFRPRRLQCHPR